MTLDEAIIHAKELSENQSICEDCREEHKQLAEWLEQLKRNKDKECEISSREMFEALGYEEQFKNSDIYRNKKDGSRIAFDNYEGGTIDVVELSYIPRELLKAINMRCQELGWI